MPPTVRSLLLRLRRFARRTTERLKGWAGTPQGKRILSGLQRGVTIAILGYVVYQVTTIGWGQVWNALPTTPWFYVIFLVMYFLLPVFQTIAYRYIWKRPYRELFPALLKSAVYNKEVLNYSGEVYLLSWGRTRLDRATSEIAHHIKDNTIISSAASTLNAVLILAILVLSGYVDVPVLSGQTWFYIAGGLVGIVAILAVAFQFRHSVFKISTTLVFGILALYFFRFLLLQGLQVTQWAVTVPGIALSSWLTLLAAQIVTKRLPFIPGPDLFVALGLEMAGAMAVPEAALAGVLLVQRVLDKSLGLFIFAGVSWFDRSGPPSMDDEADDLAANTLPTAETDLEATTPE
ncbi:MAG: hypothetical protein GVY35_08875 [Bacteroidetes bacterium]|jgi:hypothetical protein|nr:hypothetical protein [Bacteroidota bacterium]